MAIVIDDHEILGVILKNGGLLKIIK